MSTTKEHNSLLNSIFTKSKDSPQKLFPILNSSEKIPTIINFLKDSKNAIKNKISFLSSLITLFKENQNLIPCFMDKCTSNRSNLFEPLIQLYLDEKIPNEDLLKIEEIIKILIINVTTPKSTLEYIYQRLSKYFTKEGENNNKEVLKEDKFIKYLRILKLFYGEEIPKDLDQSKTRQNSLISKPHSNTMKIKNELIPIYKIKNYIYFNGKDSKLSFKINKESKNINSDFPTLEYGFSFIFWIYIKRELIDYYFKLFPSVIISLVNMQIIGHNIKLVLKNTNLFQIKIDDEEIGQVEISKTKFRYDNWNYMCFYLTQKIRGKPPSIKLLINDNKDILSVTLKKDFPLNEIISSITLFENFIGRITSLLFFSFCTDIKLIDYLRNNCIRGFFKNKYLFNFFYQNEKDYFKNAKNYIYCNKYKKERSSLKLLNTNFRNQNVKNLMVFFCPFTYNKKEKYIDDIFGHFLGIPGINDGVNFYENHSKSIQQLGGINNLLPIAEMMYSCKSKSKTISYPLIDKNILTEDTFYEYLNIFKKILIGHHKNLNEAYNKNIFSKLGLFLEKFPSNVFTEKVLDILLEIGREAFQFSFENIQLNNENFLSMILLNEKIFSKFNTQNQLKLLETLYQFFTSDYSQMRDSLNLSKICLLLRYYDETKYREYCCTYHANLFKPNNNINKKDLSIMNPEMNEKTGKLFDIIQLYIDKLDPDEEEINLFKLLSLDLSPCLQKKIILAYNSHFANTSISKEVKIKTVKNLVNNNFFDIFEYVLSISLLDIRNELLNLLATLIKDYNSVLTSKIPTYMKTIFDFIADNLLPEQLIVETKNSKIEKMSKFFNKKEYINEIDKLWNFLKSMIFKQTGPVGGGKITKLEFNELYINFCIYFVSKNSNINYIYDFLLLIQEYFKNKNITNLYILYEKDFFFMWLIETIFYFNIKENTKETQKKDIYEKIKSNSVVLLQEIFLRSKDIKNKLNKIRYILNLSYKLKDMKGYKIKSTEVELIARYLLKIFLENKYLNMDLITITCYEFILFFKECDKYIGDINSIKEEQNKILNEITPPPSESENTIFRNFTSALFSLKTEELFPENNNTSASKSSNKDNDDEILNVKIDYSDLLKKEEVIPDCIYKGLYYFADVNLKDKGKPNKAGPLYKIWKDFSFYEKIINYYSDKYWGLEKICKEIKEDPKKKNNDLYKKLIKEYGENRSYKNILYGDLMKLLNITDSATNDEFSINVLNINIQLLSIAYNLAKEKKDKEKIEKKIQQLIIYCVIASINININEKFYDIMQDKLYDILGFALLVIRKPNPKLCIDILDNLISPIFVQVDNELNKKGFLKLLRIPRKNIYTNTSIFKLFYYEGKSSGDEKINLKSRTMFINSQALNQNPERSKTESNLKGDKSYDSSNDGLLLYKGDENRLLKHSFQYALIYYRNLRLKIKLKDLKTLYTYVNSNTSNDLDNNTFINKTKERIRINKSIKKLIPNLESQITKYSNTSFLSEKKRRNNYKSTKRMLFSWCGFWSNKYLFYEHPEMLKLKRMNHVTKDMAQLLMKPILDIEYYLPHFKKFDKKKLFNKNDYHYQINLDIDEILYDEEYIKGDKGHNKNFFEPKKNEEGFNYLECIYKHSYDDLWEKYKSYYDQKLSIENVGLVCKASYDILISNKEISKDIEKMKVENIYYCCLVKITHHIRGYASTEKNRIVFIYESEQYHTKSEIENDPGYDKDMSSCFGSIFNGHQKDKDIIHLEIKYDDIKYMFMKIYFYNVSAIEIYTELNKSFFFTFKNNKDLTKFKNDIVSHVDFREIKIDEINNKTIGYEKVNSPEDKKINYYITSKYEEWRNYSVSTFELLMWLNIFSGRSFNDLTQYPVFPWIISNYDTDDLNEETDMRDLSLPMGMLEINDKSEARKEVFNEIYESVKNDLGEIDKEFNYQEYIKKGEEYYDTYLQNKFKNNSETNDITFVQPNQFPYFYGTHYSNPTYISHYLTRIFPYSLIAIEIQGEKFDDPDRLFTSMKKTFESATSLKDDVRELIPEFYSMPEILMNINNLNLAQNKLNAENKLAEINNVELPPWASNFSYNFVIQLRKSLESEKCKINNWLDLIFGYKQKGQKAVEFHNLYSGNSYIGNVKIDLFNDTDIRNALMRLVEVGMTPLKLFDAECKPRIEKNLLLTKNPIYSSNKGVFFYESNKINIKYIKTSKYKRICQHFYYNNNSSSNKDYKINIYPKIAKIKWINNEFIKLITNSNLYYSINISKINENSPCEESELCEIENQSSKFSPSYLISGIHIPIIVYNDNKYMLKGGFWDGRVEINSITPEEKFSHCIFPNEDDPVVVMEMSTNEKYLLCGTKKGFVIIYSINNNNFKIIDKLFYHNEEITSISINDNLNMFATSSKDGCIMLHTLPNFKLIRTIKLTQSSINKSPIGQNEENEFIFASNVFLSSLPIPCITVFISSEKIFKTFSINGVPLFENNESGNSILINCSTIIHNFNFQDILIYGSNNGFIKARKFPDMSLVKTIEFLDGQPIETFALSQDHRFCYAYSGGDNICIVSDEETCANTDNKIN